MSTSTTVHCPLCGLTVLGQGPDDAAAVVAAIDLLDQHITDHRNADQERDA